MNSLWRCLLGCIILQLHLSLTYQLSSGHKVKQLQILLLAWMIRPKRQWKEREGHAQNTPGNWRALNGKHNPAKAKASLDTSASNPIMERGITITTHSLLGQEWVEQLGRMVVHSTYMLNPTTRFKLTYHASECY